MCSHAQSDTLKGDLYFGLWRYGSLYEVPKDKVEIIENLAASDKRDTLDMYTQQMLNLYDTLKDEGLLYSPYVQLKTPNDSIVRVYLKLDDYKTVTEHKLDSLIKKGEKITIQIIVRAFGPKLYYCEQLLSAVKSTGTTYPIQRKFKLEEYP